MARKKKGLEEFISGLSMIFVFGFLYFFVFHRAWWMLFPLVFAGILPAVQGFLRYIGERDSRQRIPENNKPRSPGDPEKIILRLARKLEGRVTPALVAIESDLSIEKAEEVLQNLVKRGFTSMEVRDNGTIEYFFEEFLPPSTDRPGLLNS